jgi:GNAT superfamily N-acetyltransferase
VTERGEAARRGGAVRDAIPERLAAHLREWLGAWPPPERGLLVAGSPRRTREHGGRWWVPVLAVTAPLGTVVSVPPSVRDAVERLGDDAGSAAYWKAVAALVCDTTPATGRAILRWTETPADLPQRGRWVDPADPHVPAWLRVFDGEVLVALDEEGRFLAGAGRKQHDPFGHEISVGTEPAARGRGLARSLVVQLARRILAEGAIPTYLHDPANTASRRVAEATGFPDRGWRATALWTVPGDGRTATTGEEEDGRPD